MPPPSVEHDDVPVSPFLQPVKVSLNGSTSVWCVIHSSQFCIICKHTESALCPTMEVINEDLIQYWLQYKLMGQTTSV